MQIKVLFFMLQMPLSFFFLEMMDDELFKTTFLSITYASYLILSIYMQNILFCEIFYNQEIINILKKILKVEV